MKANWEIVTEKVLRQKAFNKKSKGPIWPDTGKREAKDTGGKVHL